MSWLRTARASARLEVQEIGRSRVFLLLTVLQAVSFLALVSLFGLTGSRAPMALIDDDRTHQSATFIRGLESAYHSFRLRPMSAAGADREILTGRLVGSITIPQGFGAAIERGETVPVQVRVDNVNVDLTNDVQRALPAAIVWTGRELGLPGIRVAMVEHDLNPRDTEYVPYLVVSALALDGFVVAGVLGAMAVGREWERRTIKLWRLSPAAPTALLAGKLLAVLSVAAVALAAAVAVMVLAYRVRPQAPLALAGSLLASLILFSCLGALVGALLKRTLPAVPLIFGLALPFYIDSGALEPTRFDGEPIWTVAHLSPLYYAMGALQWAVHGLQITPEPVLVDVMVLALLAAGALWGTLVAVSQEQAR